MSHRKYERTKEIIGEFKKNEDILKEQVKDISEKLKKSEDRFELLKSHAEGKLNELPKDLNLTYPEKYTLLEMGNYINSLTNDSVDVILQSEGLGLDYTGCSEKLSDLNLDLIGLDEGICQVMKHLQEQN